MKKLSVILAAIYLTFALSAPAVFAAEGAKQKKGERAKQREELLKKYDKNGDGKLDADERTAAKADHKKHATKRDKKSANQEHAADKPAK